MTVGDIRRMIEGLADESEVPVRVSNDEADEMLDVDLRLRREGGLLVVDAAIYEMCADCGERDCDCDDDDLDDDSDD